MTLADFVAAQMAMLPALLEPMYGPIVPPGTLAKTWERRPLTSTSVADLSFAEAPFGPRGLSVCSWFVAPQPKAKHRARSDARV